MRTTMPPSVFLAPMIGAFVLIVHYCSMQEHRHHRHIALRQASLTVLPNETVRVSGCWTPLCVFEVLSGSQPQGDT